MHRVMRHCAETQAATRFQLLSLALNLDTCPGISVPREVMTRIDEPGFRFDSEEVKYFFRRKKLRAPWLIVETGGQTDWWEQRTGNNIMLSLQIQE